jgi:hypothetical protein
MPGSDRTYPIAKTSMRTAPMFRTALMMLIPPPVAFDPAVQIVAGAWRQ